MSVLPIDASFEEQVQDCFLAYRGAGLMLSPLDAELLRAWAVKQVPLEVVARGIRRAAEAAVFDAVPGERVLRSLRACRKQVESEIRKYLGQAGPPALGRPPESQEKPPHLKRDEKLKTALRKIARDHPRLEAGVLALKEGLLRRPPGDLAEASAREERVEMVLLRALPFSERIEILREAGQLAQNSTSASWRARRVSRRFHRAAKSCHGISSGYRHASEERAAWRDKRPSWRGAA